MRNKIKIENEETRFFKALKDVFIGEKLEGESGYINLMKIKSKYFDKIFKVLKREIEEKTKEFPEFKKELFDKLYSFFKRYFSESGSIYFRHTPFSEKIFERVYTENKDVVMFWKTNMLYYVKTDIHPKNMEVFINGLKFFFDVSKLQPKKAWEKRELVYEFNEIKNGKIVFYVYYSERGRKTKIREILKTLKEKGINLEEETLERAFRVFEKQNEVDYFINKNAKKFLKEQFDLWLYQYVYSDETQFTPKRIRQLKVLKEIAYKIIDFISQFETELVKIWQKPKFVLNSNYVITLDKIVEKNEGIKIIEKIVERLAEQKKEFKEKLEELKKIKSENKSYRKRLEKFGEPQNQLIEWYLLDIIDEDFDPKKIFTITLIGKSLNQKYQFLPIDTKYFKDLELEILSLFDNLDEELDGWLIKSENWQALNTILPKFMEKVQLIYIDPPFNTGSNEFTMYVNRFLDSAWISMMENRLRLAKEILKDTGSIYVRIDYHGNHYIRFLMNDIFGKENFRNEILVNRIVKKGFGANRLPTATDSLIFFVKNISSNFVFNTVYKKLKKPKKGRWHDMTSMTAGRGGGKPRIIFGKLLHPPQGRAWTFSQEKIDQLISEKKIRIRCRKCGYIHYEGIWNKCPKCGNIFDITVEYYLPPTEKEPVDSNWTDIPGYSFGWDFPTENSEQLLKRVIQASSNPGDLVMDFFLGSGTTIAVAHKLGRKWIGVEMGDLSVKNPSKDFFYTVTLVRMKKVLAYDPSGISKNEDVKEKYNKNKAGGFFKYYELEQYEDTLRKVKYFEDEIFFDPTQDPYNQYIFMKDLKLLEALEIDYQSNKVKVSLSKLYPNIDIVETLSNLVAKWIKRIAENYVEFEDGEKIDIKKLDYKLIKPLIWWE